MESFSRGMELEVVDGEGGVLLIDSDLKYWRISPPTFGKPASKYAYTGKPRGAFPER